MTCPGSALATACRCRPASDMPVEYRIRFAVVDDELSALHARAFGIAAGPPSPWAQRLSRYALTWVGAFAGAQLIGFVQVSWDGGEHAFLLDTTVDPAWHHNGIGTSLVRAATEAARSAGCSWLHVDFEPSLERFYLDACDFRATRAGVLRLR
jgi:ribosomal protein S18 acetylase RimI-like enzyme